MRRGYLMGLLVMGVLASHLQAQEWELHALSGDVVAGETFVLLVWPEKEGAAGFNLYRKEAAHAPYPGTPLNTEPLSVMTDCDEIKEIIPPGSEEWEALSKGLATPLSRPKKPRFPPLPPGELVRTLPGGYVPFNPCQIASIPDTAQAYQRLQALAHFYWKIAVVMGQAYLDSNVTVGTTYWYEIRGVDEAGMETGVLDTDVRVRAGTVVLPPAPTGVSAEAGDSKVLITWEEMRNALGFDILRRTGMSPLIKINESVTVSQCTKNLAGEPIPEVNCFVDFQRWDEAGNPIPHLVEGNSVGGPRNGTTYYYRVRARDLLGRPGSLSAEVSALPHDMTPPAVPADVRVEALTDALEIRWLKVTHDAEGHKELGGINGYRVYRYESPDSETGVQIGGIVPHPVDTAVSLVTHKDGDPTLRSEYGERDYWYRVQCIDGAGNEGPLSAAVAGHLKDITPPPPPRELAAEGFAQRIELEWKPPDPVHPDLAGYMVYRGVCGCESVYVYQCMRMRGLKVLPGIDTIETTERKPPREGCELIRKYCRPYPVHPIANLDDPDTLQYDDYTVPEGSPICYRYAVKAYDRSQNLSDTSKTVCQRLREETPPPPPVISSLKARNRAIRVEWVAPPVQDLFGFIVERSETGSDPWVQVSPDLDFPEAFGCEDIPATNIWAEDTTFSFLDTTVVPKRTHWYRVRGADYGRNIGDPSVAIETYTYDFTGPAQPTILSVDQTPDRCALRISWDPPYDAAYLGFVVFRSSSGDCCYRQISPIIEGNEFVDEKVAAGREYWYKVQYFGRDGNRSLVSTPKNGMAME